MGSEPRPHAPAGARAPSRRARRAWLVRLAALSGSALPLLLVAQGTRSAAGIYTCVDARGRKLTSDRPIAECTDREQRVLNRDGSVRDVVPPSLTAEERAEREARERRAAQQRAAQADAVRRDRNLMTRFPDQAAHDRARESALETVRMASRATDQRLQALATERKRLDDEAEFYKGRPMPAALRQRIDANDGAVAAQRAAQRNQEAERSRINALYDAELARLKRLWAGAEPGSLPPASAPELPDRGVPKPPRGEALR